MKSKTALVNTAENPDPMKEKIKNLIRTSPTFLKISKLTEREGKYFSPERESSGISDLASGFTLAVLYILQVVTHS